VRVLRWRSEVVSPVRVALAVAALGFCAEARATDQEGAGAEVVVRSRVCLDADRRVVTFALSCQSEARISLLRESLPWEHHASMLLQAARLDRAVPWLEPALPVSDPRGGTIDCTRATRLSGEISVSERFPDFEAVLRDTDIAVFWAFRVRARGHRSNALAGAFIQSRRGGRKEPGEASCKDQILVFSQESGTAG